ncbi:MAG TPA: ATP-binding cassette domain-containing protein [Actinomycetota bacterium]|nr:ATP-binding cassette domain-containing protein [Actinomycetota bacterium]
MSTGAPPVAAADRVTKTYETALRSTRALDEVSAAFHGDRLTAVAGPSGSGKSTLLRILAGLDVPSDGDVTVCGTALTRLGPRGRRRLRRTRVAFLFQRPSDNLVSYLTAEQHLTLARELRGEPGRDPGDVLDQLGISHAAGRRPHELSGGEQQRLAVAQAVVVTPALLLLDEPTAELDRENAENIVGLLRAAATGGTAVVVSSHDRVVTDAADEVVELVDGRVRS